MRSHFLNLYKEHLMTPTIPTISIKGIFLDTPLPLGHLGHDHYCVTASLSLKATTPSSEPRILRLILVLPDSKQIDTIVELRTNFANYEVMLTGWLVKPQLRYTNTDTYYWLTFRTIEDLVNTPITVISECGTAFLIKSIAIEAAHGPAKLMKFTGHTYLIDGTLKTQEGPHQDFELDPLKALFFHSDNEPKRRRAKTQQPVAISVIPPANDIAQLYGFQNVAASEPGDLHLYEILKACHPYDSAEYAHTDASGSDTSKHTGKHKGSGNSANIKPRPKYTPSPTLHAYAKVSWKSLHDLPSGEHTGFHLTKATANKPKPVKFHALLEDEYDLDD